MSKLPLDGLRLRKYDLIFCVRPVESDNLSCVPIDRQELVLIVPKDHPLAENKSVSLEDTLQYPYIYFNNKTGLRFVIDELFEAVGRRPEIAYETDEEQIIFGLVAYGFGIAVTPYREILLKLNVKILPIVRPAWEGNIYMVSNKQVYLTPAVTNFRDFILRQLLEQQESPWPRNLNTPQPQTASMPASPV